ncbi:MAG: hypothetical protein HC814_05685 [Rhodobacteraceae bacterium]|nr:hypothetical protein [Paracoccaceae bacterium]
MTVVSTGGFPWWREIKYPVKIEISVDRIRYWDQSGSECTVDRPFLDEELGALIVPSCGETKSSVAIRPFLRLSICQGELYGQVWTYKQLFDVRGTNAIAAATPLGADTDDAAHDSVPLQSLPSKSN